MSSMMKTKTKTQRERDCETTQLVIDQLVLDQLMRRLRGKSPRKKEQPRRPRFEPVRLLTPSSWRASDLMTLGLGAVLIVGLFVAVGQGLTWVILPGAVAVIFAMISTQLRWGETRRGRWLRNQRLARRREDDDHTGGIVQLPARKDPKRRTG
jgi:hypothetical protein